jgi:hypothetical protein
MKRALRPYSLLALLLILLGSCGKKSNVPVPENAGMVIHINGASLNSKLSWDEFKQGELYKMAKAEVKDELAQKILENPDSSGVDIKSDAWFFMANTGANSYVAFTCNLKDDKIFGRVMQKIEPMKTITKQGELSVMKMGNDAVVTWSSNRFVIIGEGGDFNRTPYLGGGSRSTLTQDSLLKIAQNVYDIKGSKSIASNSKFSSMIKEEGDLHLWVGGGGMYNQALTQALTMLPKLGLLLQGNFSAATVNFANGKITMSSKTYYNKELKELYSKYNLKNIDESTLKKIPAGDVDAVFASNYPPEALQGLLSLIGVDGLANAYLSQLNYSVEEFVKGNKGDVIVAVSDFKMTPHETSYDIGNGQKQTYTTTKPEVKVLFATSVKEKASWDKLMAIIHGKIAEEGGQAAAQIIDKIPYTLNNEWFVAGSDSSYVHAFGSASIDHDFIRKLSGHPFGAYINIRKFINGARPSFGGDSSALTIADESVRLWEDIVFYGGDKDDDGIKSYGEINFIDNNTNSLKQLNNYFGKIASILKAQEDKRKAAWEDMKIEDSVKTEAIPPPPIPMKKEKKKK